MKEANQWSSKLGFILAAAGSAIGLGAIWKFPYVAGTSGGGAFLLIFILFTVLIGLPLLLGEFIIGRRTQKDAVQSYKTLAPGTKWHWDRLFRHGDVLYSSIFLQCRRRMDFNLYYKRLHWRFIANIWF